MQAKNPKQSLRPGSNVQVSMVLKEIPDALVIPSASLLTAQDGTTAVMTIAGDGRARQKAVKAGIKQGDEVQILEGLQAGEKVVSEGAYGLPDNCKIEIQEPGKPDEPSKDSKESDDKK